MSRIVDLAKGIDINLFGEFIDDYDKMVKRIFVDKIPTAFPRYNEGEYYLMTNKKFVGAGKIWQTYEYLNTLREDLIESYKRNEPGYIYGIASIQHAEANKRYIENRPSKNITFATLFCNYNYRNFQNIIKSIREGVVLIANEKAISASYPFKVVDLVAVPNDVVLYYEKNKVEILADIDFLISKWHNTLFLFCAGPLSNILIDYAWNKNKTNRYIDIGSILDPYTYSIPTRQYFTEGSKTFNQIDTLGLSTINDTENPDMSIDEIVANEAMMKTLNSRQPGLMISFKPRILKMGLKSDAEMGII